MNASRVQEEEKGDDGKMVQSEYIKNTQDIMLNSINASVNKSMAQTKDVDMTQSQNVQMNPGQISLSIPNVKQSGKK